MDPADAVGFLFVYLIFCFIFGAIGSSIGKGKGAARAGFWFGLLLGPVGLVIALLLDNRATCPKCNGRINGRPEICPHCRSSLAEKSVEPEEEEPDLIEIKCPACRRHSTVAGSQAGQKVVCEHCGELVRVSNLVACPDCGKKISRRAAACPDCGCPTK